MKKINSHSIKSQGQRFFALFSLLWVILSSCTVQATISALSTNDLTSIEQSTKPNKPKHSNKVVFSPENCQNQFTADSDVVIQKAGIDISNPYVALLISTFVFFFFGFAFLKDFTVHPLYSSKTLLRGNLPLFIQHQNFRI